MIIKNNENSSNSEEFSFALKAMSLFKSFITKFDIIRQSIDNVKKSSRSLIMEKNDIERKRINEFR